jgi:hypothetical protein
MNGTPAPENAVNGLSSFTIPGRPGEEASDRRGSDRFPIEREMRYRLTSKRDVGTEGSGQTVNISSNGVLFRTADAGLVPGKRIEMSINWPAQLDNRCFLKLVARGRITRVTGDEVAVEIHQYEFRTAGRAAPSDQAGQCETI